MTDVAVITVMQNIAIEFNPAAATGRWMWIGEKIGRRRNMWDEEEYRDERQFE